MIEYAEYNQCIKYGKKLTITNSVIIYVIQDNSITRIRDRKKVLSMRNIEVISIEGHDRTLSRQRCINKSATTRLVYHITFSRAKRSDNFEKRGKLEETEWRDEE